ncbi:hypothetical protein BH10ACT11_BH10ACT11_22080 [soil metagenome]
MPKLTLVREAGAETAAATGSRPAVLVVDDRRRCVEVNREACDLLGLEREAVVGGRIDRLVSTEMRGRLELFWRAFREGGGHGGPFDLAQPGRAAAVVISLTENLIPGRHLVVISPADGSSRLAPSTRPDPSSEPSPARNGVRGPSPREREVLKLLATGATDPQIAVMLELSPATVQTHVRNAKSKLGARTRAQAVAIALSDGLISA